MKSVLLVLGGNYYFRAFREVVTLLNRLGQIVLVYMVRNPKQLQDYLQRKEATILVLVDDAFDGRNHTCQIRDTVKHHSKSTKVVLVLEADDLTRRPNYDFCITVRDLFEPLVLTSVLETLDVLDD